MLLEREELIKTLRRVSLLTSDRNMGITVHYHGGQVDFMAAHPDLGTACCWMPVEDTNRNEEVILNAAYLMEAVRKVKADTVPLFFPIKDYAPAWIDNELIMPMKR